MTLHASVNDIHTRREFFTSVNSFKIRQKIVSCVQKLNVRNASGIKWQQVENEETSVVSFF